MFIAVPHQRPPHFGYECLNGDRDCDADCDGCREMRDSHAVVGDWDTPEDELAELALAYTGHQSARVHQLGHELRGDTWCRECQAWHGRDETCPGDED